MSVRLLLQLVVAALVACSLSACDLFGGNQQREALWQAEVEAVALVLHADAAAEGHMEAFDSLRASRDAIDNLIGATASKPAPAEILNAWTQVRQSADVILSHQQVVLTGVDAEADFQAALPQLMARLDEVGRGLASGSDAKAGKQSFLVGRNQVLLQRMAARIGRIRAGQADAVSAADAFNRDGTVLEQTLAGLQDGNAELGIEAIADPQAHQVLAEVRSLYAEVRSKADPLLESTTAALETREAADELSLAVESLRSALQRGRIRR